jgi:hypothetical protein
LFLQYNEILGKGASKTVYESKFLSFINLLESHLEIFFSHLFAFLVFFAWVWWTFVSYFCKSWSLLWTFCELLVMVSDWFGQI